MRVHPRGLHSWVDPGTGEETRIGPYGLATGNRSRPSPAVAHLLINARGVPTATSLPEQDASPMVLGLSIPLGCSGALERQPN